MSGPERLLQEDEDSDEDNQIQKDPKKLSGPERLLQEDEDSDYEGNPEGN